MVVIQGLGGVPEPKSERPGKVRSERESGAQSTAAAGSNTGVQSKDDVTISSEAKAAAEVARLVQLSKSEADIRADRVNEARERIENGSYKDREVVAKVAERVMKYLV